MAGQRQPTDLVVMNGRKHLTKAEIEARKNAEVTAPCDKVRPPSYLTPEQKKQFRKIAKELLEIKLISNLDCDALARLLIAQTQYIEITGKVLKISFENSFAIFRMFLGVKYDGGLTLSHGAVTSAFFRASISAFVRCFRPFITTKSVGCLCPAMMQQTSFPSAFQYFVSHSDTSFGYTFLLKFPWGVFSKEKRGCD